MDDETSVLVMDSESNSARRLEEPLKIEADTRPGKMPNGCTWGYLVPEWLYLCLAGTPLKTSKDLPKIFKSPKTCRQLANAFASKIQDLPNRVELLDELLYCSTLILRLLVRQCTHTYADTDTPRHTIDNRVANSIS
jgi:hypothetical protein